MSRGWHQFTNQDQPTQGSDPATRLTSAGGSRIHLWNAAIDAFQAHPWDGVGPGTYEFWWTQHGSEGEFVRDAHSLYLEQLAELGGPGLALLLALFGGLVASALLARRNLIDEEDLGANIACVAAFLVFAVTAAGDWMWEVTAVGGAALAGLALAAGGGVEPITESVARWQRVPEGEGWHRLRNSRSHLPSGVRVALCLLAILIAGTEVPGIVSTQRLHASEQALKQGDLARSKRMAKQSISAEPWSASAHLQLAAAIGRQGHLRLARRQILIARAKEPTNWRIPLVLAPVQARLGNRAAARRTYRQGRRLYPHSLLYAAGIPPVSPTTGGR